MNIKNIIVSACAIFALAACDKSSEDTTTETKTYKVPMEVTQVKPPKRFKINVVDEKGNKYEYSKKRCSIHTHYVVGQKYLVEVVETTTTSPKIGTTTKIEVKSFCDTPFQKLN